MPDNMSIYNATKECPSEALKQITGGKLKGMSDINPMWRIKTLTEQFGACGIGWYYDVDKQWTEQGANGECAAFCNISLYIKIDGEWSKPIKGTGGSKFITNNKNGSETSDECYKMALTDAISVACKALGFAANVYWNAGRQTKYDTQPANDKPVEPVPKCSQCGKIIMGSGKYSAQDIAQGSFNKYGRVLCVECGKAEKAKAAE